MAVPHPALLSTLLLSTNYLLLLCIPLLLVSIILTFAGAFLTLDRSRYFPRSYTALPGGAENSSKRHVFGQFLESGVGGLAAGFAFGVHFSTFLTLLIPSLTSSAPLTPSSFSAVWVLSAITTTLLAGRWRYVAFAFSGISGGAILSVCICVIIHPSLLTRIVLCSIFTPILTVLCLLPFPKTHHPSLRLALTSTGAFGIVLVIALFSHIPAWADVWDRLWVSTSVEWDTGKEKGLSAAWCFLVLGGVASDWFLKWRFGENPEEKWDNYLANYAANLPNASDRAGTFRPSTSSLWARIFPFLSHDHPSPPVDKVIFPTDDDLKFPPSPFADGPLKSQSNMGVRFSPTFLKKPAHSRSQARFSTRSTRVIKFQPAGVSKDFLDSSDEDDGFDTFEMPPFFGSSRAYSRLSATTNDGVNGLDLEKDMVKIRNGLNGADDIPEYSDYEEDVTSVKTTSRNEPGWSPSFLKRHKTSAPSFTTSEATAVALPLPSAVPMTPSLMHALDRIQVAQQAAYVGLRPGLPASKSSDTVLNEGLPKPPKQANTLENGEDKRKQWDEFWRDVGAKAG